MASTTIIHTVKNSQLGSGTGFFMTFEFGQGMSVPVIVTNKHVIRNANECRFNISINKGTDEEPKVDGFETFIVDGEFNKFWIEHPSDDVDLAVFPFAPVLKVFEERDQKPFYRTVSREMIPNERLMAEYGPGQSIVMIGYPQGLWDEANNMPIMRRGILATHPSLRFGGKPQFMIDCACFPGSSGSPVFALDMGSFAHEGKLYQGNRVAFLGVLFAGPQYNAVGEIVTVPVPTEMVPVPVSRIPNNLGYCVRSEEVRFFDQHFSEDATRAAEAIRDAGEIQQQ